MPEEERILHFYWLPTNAVACGRPGQTPIAFSSALAERVTCESCRMTELWKYVARTRGVR